MRRAHGAGRRSENRRADLVARREPTNSHAESRIARATTEGAAASLTTADFLRAASSETTNAEETSRSARGGRTAAPVTRDVRRPLVEDRVEANDMAIAPVERPATLRIAREEEADTSGGVPAPNGVAEHDLRAQADGVSPALVHASRQELADEAMQPVVLPGLYRNGRLVMPAPLKGSHDILVHQNLMADDEGLERIRDDEELDRLRASHQLVDFPESAGLRVNPELAYDRRCARVWTVRFAEDIAQAFYARFHEPLQVNSAVRTVQYQLRLERVNGNAAPVAGDVASPHLTGQAIDFGKGEMTRDEIAWMRAYLLPLMQAGKVDVEEEFQQACFHISVYRSYAPARRRAVKTEVAEVQ